MPELILLTMARLNMSAHVKSEHTCPLCFLRHAVYMGVANKLVTFHGIAGQ